MQSPTARHRCFANILPRYITAIIFFISIHSGAQTSNTSAEVVANAEKKFAAEALLTSTKQAFLEFYSDDVIVFRNGNAVKGKPDWMGRKVDSSQLWWQPVFADMAHSGDFGYTTGPWEWKKLKDDNTPSAYGYYNSIWKKQNDGTWKVVIDIGIPVGSPSVERNLPIRFPTTQSVPAKKSFESLKKELVDMEKAFVSSCHEHNNTAYNKYISSEARVYRPNNPPYTSAAAVRQALADTSLTFGFEFIDGDIASSGDLGYVYGKVKATGMYNGQAVNTDLNYMRIWRRESNGGWKIVLDVIGGR